MLMSQLLRYRRLRPSLHLGLRPDLGLGLCPSLHHGLPLGLDLGLCPGLPKLWSVLHLSADFAPLFLALFVLSPVDPSLVLPC